jgi:hypothetical protein
LAIILGLVLSSKAKPKSSKHGLKAKELADRFCLIARQEPVLGPLAVIGAEGDDGKTESTVLVLPIDENVHFYQHGRNVKVSAATNATGPGYHDYLVGLLDQLIAGENLVATEEEGWLDETGYWSHRDYAVLQTHMSIYFNMVSKIVVGGSRAEGHGPLSLSLKPSEILDDFKAETVTVRGPRDAAFFGITGEAANFFPWWDFALPPAAALGLAEAMLWLEFPWRAPIDHYEAALVHTISELVKIAQEEPRLNSDTRLNVVGFQAASTSMEWPHSTGMGYLRYSRMVNINDNWWIKLPGYFASVWDEHFKQEVFKCFGCVVIVAIGLTEKKDRSVIGGFEGKLDISVVKDDLSFYGILRDKEYEAGKPGKWLDGCAVAKDEVAVVAIMFNDLSLQQWATDTFLTIRTRS